MTHEDILLYMIKEILWRPVRWLISIILLPIKLLLSLVGKVISMLISLILLVLISIGLLMYFGWIPPIESLPMDTLSGQ